MICPNMPCKGMLGTIKMFLNCDELHKNTATLVPSCVCGGSRALQLITLERTGQVWSKVKTKKKKKMQFKQYCSAANGNFVEYTHPHLPTHKSRRS